MNGGFDPSMDKEIHKEQIQTKKGSIELKIMQYGDGDKKIQVSRLNVTEQGEQKFAKLGRLTADEGEIVGEGVMRLAKGIKLKEY